MTMLFRRLTEVSFSAFGTYMFKFFCHATGNNRGATEILSLLFVLFPPLARLSKVWCVVNCVTKIRITLIKMSSKNYAIISRHAAQPKQTQNPSNPNVILQTDKLVWKMQGLHGVENKILLVSYNIKLTKVIMTLYVLSFQNAAIFPQKNREPPQFIAEHM